MKRMSVLVLALLLPIAACIAEVPVRSESLVWTSLAWNGRDYSATFAPETSDTLFLIAGIDNFLSLRKTLIYWWPITSQWKTDTDSLNIQFPGTLELRQGRTPPRTQQMVEYTYFNVRGEYELNWRVATGEAARRELAKYAALYDSYFKAVREYESKTAAYETELRSLGARIQKLKDEHLDYSALLQRMNALPEPTPPTPPNYYEVPPSVLQQAFILNLPPGRYAIRLLNARGMVMEGSEKTVLVHRARRTGGVGFEVIPSDKWTRPEESQTPSSVLYVSGKADLYLRPYFEDEFNDMAYEKTINNAARGNPSIARWVRTQQVPHAQIGMEKLGSPTVPLSEEPFTVVQSTGNSLGYTIVPWDSRAATGGKKPSLVAFRVGIGEGDRAIRLRCRDSHGQVLTGSEREIRVVKPYGAAGLLLALTLSPLAAMVIRILVRSRSYSSEKVDDS
jgi:hypothetical protein